MNEGGDVEDAAVESAVRQLLARDEARIISTASLVLMAVGFVFSVMWFAVAWRTQAKLSGGGHFGLGGDESNPDVVDRILNLVEISGYLMFALMVFAAGCGLRLFAGRLLSERRDIDDLDDGNDGDGPVYEVTLQPDA